MKSFWQSKTIRTAIAAIATAAGTILTQDDPATIAAAWAVVINSAVMIGLRWVTVGPIK